MPPTKTRVPTRATPAAPPARGDSARDILRVAAELFRQRGYTDTSLAAIGERLGMSAAALYYHYRSKEEILLAYLENALRDVTVRVEAALSTVSSPEQRLRVFTITHATFQLEPLGDLSAEARATHYGISQLIGGLDPRNRRKMAKQLRAYVDIPRAIIQEGIAQGVFRPVDVTASVFAILGMVEFAPLWFRPDGQLDSEGVASLYASFAVRMVSALPSDGVGHRQA